MGNISIETPSGPLNFKISGDRPSRTETIRINQYLRKYNRENYYKIKYEQLLEEHQELQKRYDLTYETQNTTAN